MKITHLTSVHQRDDVRIFVKQCRSLAMAGHEVTLIVADGIGDATREGVRIVDAGASRGRLGRIAGAPRRVLRRAIETHADIYHFHDPELLPAGLKLKHRGARVVFDSHEDVPQDILTKPYIPRQLRPAVSATVAMIERHICRRLDGVVAATPFIRDKFVAMGVRTIDINNYPILGELETGSGWPEKRREVCYVGGISANRGIVEVVRAMQLTAPGISLNLAGKFGEAATETSAKAEPGWARVNALGMIDRAGVRDVLARSVAGLVTFLPSPNHLDAQPNKMFEYMSAGIPVIASGFPLWRSIVEGSECGLLVDPLDPTSIAAAIDRLVGDPALAQRLGENGRRAIGERYNWAVEAKKLVDFYATLGA